MVLHYYANESGYLSFELEAIYSSTTLTFVNNDKTEALINMVQNDSIQRDLSLLECSFLGCVRLSIGESGGEWFEHRKILLDSQKRRELGHVHVPTAK